MKWESEFLFVELRNEIQEHADTHGEYIQRRKAQSFQHKHWEGVKSPQKAEIYSEGGNRQNRLHLESRNPS